MNKIIPPELPWVTSTDDWPTRTKNDLSERYDAIQLSGVLGSLSNFIINHYLIILLLDEWSCLSIQEVIVSRKIHISKVLSRNFLYSDGIVFNLKFSILLVKLPNERFIIINKKNYEALPESLLMEHCSLVIVELDGDDPVSCAADCLIILQMLSPWPP